MAPSATIAYRDGQLHRWVQPGKYTVHPLNHPQPLTVISCNTMGLIGGYAQQPRPVRGWLLLLLPGYQQHVQRCSMHWEGLL